MEERVGFIGLGIMGRGMAHNVLKAGFPLTVWNRTRERTEVLAASGAEVAASPADLAARSDVIITCVSDTADVREVILGGNGVFHGVRPGSLVIDMSTISPEATRQIAAALTEKSVEMLDAPISGGSEGAAMGTLSIMVGGQEEALARAMPI
ncbi:MAG: NAD(P)-dependent oxidoreductase, partial [Anaerolineae bacterium]